MNGLTFMQCLKRIRNGDMDGLKIIYEAYHEKLIATAKHILRNDFLAEDAVSDTYMNIMRYAENNEHPRIKSLGIYLHSVVKNAAYKIFNKNKRFVSLDTSIEYAAVEDINETNRLMLKQALEHLDDVEFEIITLHYFYGYKLKEIALEISMPEGTVKWKLREIRKQILKFFKK